MIKIIYFYFGKFYRKLNILLSIFYLKKFSIKKDLNLLDKHNKIYENLLKNLQKHNNITQETDVFDSFIKFKKNLRNVLLNNEKLKKFLQLDIIHQVMFGINRLTFYKELNLLKKDLRWKSTWKNLINEDLVGQPIPFFLYPKSSGNRIHEAFNIKMMMDLDIKNKLLNIENVIEFGGGYGNLCHLFKKIYKIKKYIMYDLEEVAILQSYYLQMQGYNAQFENYKNQNNEIELIYKISTLEEVIKKINFEKTIFISNWALSESPSELRKKFENIIKKCNLNFFAFQQNFEQIDNYVYFKNLASEKKYLVEKKKRVGENHYYMLIEN